MNKSSNNTVILTGLHIFLSLLSSSKTKGIPDADKCHTFFVLYEHEPYQEIITSLCRQALNSKATRKTAVQTVRTLVRAVEDDLRLYAVMEMFIQGITHEGSSREKDRLRFYLDRWATESHRTPSVAEQLLQTV